MPRMQKPFAHYTRQEGECVVWTGAVNSTGYGSYRAGGKPRKAHHVAYEIANGPLPQSRAGHQDFVVMHTCDNRRCVNAAHLVLGTQRANVHDALTKSRLPQMAAIRPMKWRFDREEARRLRAAGMTYREIGERLGADASNVCKALRRFR